jgi:hypothetical protein
LPSQDYWIFLSKSYLSLFQHTNNAFKSFIHNSIARYENHILVQCHYSSFSALK